MKNNMNDYCYCAFLIEHNFKSLMFNKRFNELRYVLSYCLSNDTTEILNETINRLHVFYIDSPYIFDIIQKIDEEE